MKKWTTPMAMEECFTANVDVAVTTCYKVACNVQAANAYEEGHPQGITGLVSPNHTTNYCADSKNNVIKIDSNTHKIIGMEGKYKYDDVECQFTTSDYQQHIDPGVLKVGDKVFWTHQFAYFTYHHQGILELTDPNKKCMS